MEIKFDWNDRRSLLAVRPRLKKALEAVELVLAVDEELGLDMSPPPAEVIPPSNEFVATLMQLPKRFTSTQVYEVIGQSESDRNAAKVGLRRAESAGVIRVMEKGRGRRPSTYEKI